MGTGNAARVSMFTHHAGGNGNGLEAPLEENEKFRAVFEASLDPISISALDDGVYLDVNREFEQLAITQLNPH